MSDTNETIAEVLRLDEEATPGPWDYWFEAGTRLGPDREHPIALVKQMRRASCPGGVRGAGVDADAALITYYRTAAPALAREVQRLQGEIERLRLEHAEERQVSCCDGHNLGYDAAYRAGQEAMRERAAALVDRAADAACECDGTLCGPDDVAPHDEDCRRFDLDDLADAIRALEVE